MTLFRRSLVKALAVILFSVLHLAAQENQSSQEDSRNGQVVRLFWDCQGNWACRDMDFFRTEIQFVNWVRDRRDSDVHLLITSQTTGAGGNSYELFFMGQERFGGMEDILSYISGFDATQDEVRNGLASIAKIGLMRFVGLTSVAENIVIGMREDEGGGGAGGPGTSGSGGMAVAEDDPWDFWVFRTGVSGYGMGESTFKNTSISGSITASRTTEEWKTSIRLRTNYNERRFDYDDETTLSITRSQSLTGLQVKSLTDHWSAGLRGSVSSSTYENFRLSAGLAPVLEYNFFPYSEATRRSLTVQYSLQVSYFDYVEETIYFETEESLFDQSLGISLELNQPWGTTNLYGSAGHFLRDIAQHNASIGGSVEVRLARGFSVNLGGSVSRIQDRISVAAEVASVEDVLLRRKQLQTDYDYFLHFGLNYTFGSIFNNVVNPRIG